MTLVWRVECPKCGLGPYICDCNSEWHKEIQAYATTDEYIREHPGLLWDTDPKQLYEVCELYCGFSDEDQLYSWFSDLLGFLEMYGFKIAVYESERVITSKSRKQVYFSKDSQPEYMEIVV